MSLSRKDRAYTENLRITMNKIMELLKVKNQMGFIPDPPQTALPNYRGKEKK